MIYQKATIKDLDEIIKMKNRVKARVVREGLPIWLNGYPLDEMILEDINNNHARIVKKDNKINYLPIINFCCNKNKKIRDIFPYFLFLLSSKYCLLSIWTNRNDSNWSTD